MACAGCQKRRAKLVAVYHALRHGAAAVGHSYRAQTQPDPVPRADGWSARDIERLKARGAAPLEFNEIPPLKVIDIRQ